MKLSFSAIATVGIALWLPVLLLVTSLQGCETGTTGLLRPMSPGVEHGITNVLPNLVTSAATVLPVPFSAAIQATAAAVLALLAAWQGFTHERLKKLAAQSPQTNPIIKL